MDPLDHRVPPSKKTRVQAGIVQFFGPVNSNVTSEHVPYQSDLADTGSVSQHPERCDTDTAGTALQASQLSCCNPSHNAVGFVIQKVLAKQHIGDEELHHCLEDRIRWTPGSRSEF